MNNDMETMIADLKQFIAATVAQNTSDIREEIIAELRQDIKRLDQKIDDLASDVAEAIDAGHEAIDVQLDDHEKRSTRLEQKPA